MRIFPLTEEFKSGWQTLMKLYFEFYTFDADDKHIDSVFSMIIDDTSELNSLIAVIDDNVVGMANYVFMPGTFNIRNCYLSDLYTDDKYRGQGIARKLIDAVAIEAKNAACPSFYWLTRYENQQAQCLYDKIALKRDLYVYEKSTG